ncbi:MAG: DNA/RNA non-specific endonuclease, partial [Pyrinomonadaceae bacterium]
SQGNELYIIAGGVGIGGTGLNGGTTTTIGSGHVTVPAQTWKVIMVLSNGTNDVARVTTTTRLIAVVMPNIQGIKNMDWHQFRVSVNQVEAMTGYNFFDQVSSSIQSAIETKVDNQP